MLFTRRHWLYLWPKAVVTGLIGVIIPVVVLAAAGRLGGLSGAVGLVLFILCAAWFAYFALRCYLTWYRYEHDIWVVTNQRIVDSVKNHWFHHRMASADLVDVEDIAVHRVGLLPTVFRFGDVRCQTAGEMPNFILAGIPDPTTVLAVVDEARDAARRDLGRVMGR